MAFPDFEIDAVILTNQPSSIEFRPAEGQYVATAGGGFLVNKRAKGGMWIVTWGVGAAVQAIISELETRRSTTYAHTIEYEDLDAAARGPFNVLIPPIPHRMRVDGMFDVFAIQFRERPD